jgi:hypothetical protein
MSKEYPNNAYGDKERAQDRSDAYRADVRPQSSSGRSVVSSSSNGGGGGGYTDRCKIPMQYRRYWNDGRITDIRNEGLRGFAKKSFFVAAAGLVAAVIFGNKHE